MILWNFNDYILMTLADYLLRHIGTMLDRQPIEDTKIGDI